MPCLQYLVILYVETPEPTLHLLLEEKHFVTQASCSFSFLIGPDCRYCR